MKVVVTAAGPELASEVSPRFGRAPWLLLVDLEDGRHEAVSNTQNVNAAQGAGIQAAQAVVQLRAGALLTGHCGPKAFRTLTAAGIDVYVGVSGTVAEAVAKLRQGELTAAAVADVEGHWA